ncbi:hypothetical protein [Caballeronia sordidicola]|uniref:hypothetical protein n=1 Tax=Caballeronia sordidicola TaxID=196367 RepID=UPI0004CFFF94|nr:hypothetical protein [Caballeronia sordidicola]
MSTDRESFKGESLAGGTMDTMHGKLFDTTPRVKTCKPAPVASEPEVESALEAALEAEAAVEPKAAE